MFNKFLQMIRQAFYSVVSSDTSEYPQAQVTSNAKATNIVRLSSYGLFGNPPLGSHVLMFQSQGQEAVKFGVFNDMINRKKGLSEGECGLFNTLTGAIVYMKEDGSILIESSVKIDEEAPIINVDASVEVNVTAPTVNVDAGVEANVTAPTVNVDASVEVNVSAPDVNVDASAEVNVTAPIINATGTTVNVLGSAAINLEAPVITLDGAVVITGALAVTGAVGGAGGAPLSAPNGVSIGALDLGTHIHGGVKTGTDNTGGPV